MRKRLHCTMLWLTCFCATAMALKAAAKDKGLDVLISADAIASPEGFRPKPGKPVHYLYFQNSQTLGDPVAGVKLAAPEFIEKAVVAELARQGFIRTQEGGALPQIAIIAVFGDANFEEPPVPPGNPIYDGDFRMYMELVNLRQLLQREHLDGKVPTTLEQLFEDNVVSTDKIQRADVLRAQGLIIDEAIRYRERGSPRWHDREKINTLVGAGKVERAVSGRRLSSTDAQRIAEAAWDNQLYVTLSAFDAHRQQNGGRALLWRTTMLIDRRVDFAKALPEMLAQAGPVFGTDVPVPGYVNTATRKASVEIGETVVLPDHDAKAEAGAKK